MSIYRKFWSLLTEEQRRRAIVQVVLMLIGMVMLLISQGRAVKGARVFLLGWTFKENVPDVRNTRVIDIYQELEDYEVKVVAHDPEADSAEVRHESEVELVASAAICGPFDAIIFAFAHSSLREALPLSVLGGLRRGDKPILVDVKSVFRSAECAAAGIFAWQL